MGIFSVFKKEKKKKASRCAITGTFLQYGEGRLLTTSQVVSSRRFWESIMTEPETMAYTINHFKKQDKNATKMRSFIFEKYAQKDDPWIVSEDVLTTYGIEATDESEAYAQQWWESDGAFIPPNNGSASHHLSPEVYEDIKQYAIWKAGESRVA